MLLSFSPLIRLSPVLLSHFDICLVSVLYSSRTFHVLSDIFHNFHSSFLLSPFSLIPHLVLASTGFIFRLCILVLSSNSYFTCISTFFISFFFSPCPVLNSLSSPPFMLVTQFRFLSLIQTCSILITYLLLTLLHLPFFLPFISRSFLLSLHSLLVTLFVLPSLNLSLLRCHLLLNFSSLNPSPACPTSSRQASEARGDPTHPLQSSHSTFVVSL